VLSPTKLSYYAGRLQLTLSYRLLPFFAAICRPPLGSRATIRPPGVPPPAGPAYLPQARTSL